MILYQKKWKTGLGSTRVIKKFAWTPRTVTIPPMKESEHAQGFRQTGPTVEIRKVWLSFYLSHQTYGGHYDYLGSGWYEMDVELIEKEK